MSQGIALIAGLGNPGDQYTATRHNVGFWFIDRLRRQFQINFSREKKFKAQAGQFIHRGRIIRVAAADTFMNSSGAAIAAMASFFRISPEQTLIVHDELDFQPGIVRLKLGGGHGGHNGLKDIASKMGSNDFIRIRIGIGHPGGGGDAADFVLKKPGREDTRKIEQAIQKALSALPDILSGDYQKAMHALHTESGLENIPDGH